MYGVHGIYRFKTGAAAPYGAQRPGCRGGSRYVQGWWGSQIPRCSIICQDLKDSGLLIFQDALRFPKLILQTVLRFQDAPRFQDFKDAFFDSLGLTKIYLGNDINIVSLSRSPPGQAPKRLDLLSSGQLSCSPILHFVIRRLHSLVFTSIDIFDAGQRLTYNRRPRDVFLFVQRWRRFQRAGLFGVR